MGGNAVLGYCQNFDVEGDSGIVARSYGTCVFITKTNNSNSNGNDNVGDDNDNSTVAILEEGNGVEAEVGGSQPSNCGDTVNADLPVDDIIAASPGSAALSPTSVEDEAVADPNINSPHTPMPFPPPPPPPPSSTSLVSSKILAAAIRHQEGMLEEVQLLTLNEFGPEVNKAERSGAERSEATCRWRDWTVFEDAPGQTCYLVQFIAY